MMNDNLLLYKVKHIGLFFPLEIQDKIVINFSLKIK